MPFYDYKCGKCGLTFEISKGMNDTFNPSCPECGTINCQRIFTPIRTLGAERSGSGCSSCSDGVCSSCSSKS